MRNIHLMASHEDREELASIGAFHELALMSPCPPLLPFDRPCLIIPSSLSIANHTTGMAQVPTHDIDVEDITT